MIDRMDKTDAGETGGRGNGEASGPKTHARCQLLDLPGDVLSQIASYVSSPTHKPITVDMPSYLPLPQMIPFLCLHPMLLSLTRTHLSPLPFTMHNLVIAGPPYPPILAKLPSLPLFFPDDGGMIFVDILVRARPKWILERLELGRWKEQVWKEAYERRFLPSWRRFKG